MHCLYVCTVIPALLTAQSQCDTAAGNLVLSCGFEAGAGGLGNFSPGWIFSPATVGSDAGVASDNPNSGAKDAFFGASGGMYDTIQQTITTQPGQVYTLSFYLYTDGPTRDFRLYYNGVLIYDNSSAGTGTYTLCSILVAGTGNDTITFKAFNQTSFDDLDDIIFVAGAPSVLTSSGSGVEDAFQTTYISDLNNADSVINIVNAGAAARANTATHSGSGDLCVNVYVYTPDQQQAACCSCRLTPGELIYLNAGGPTEPTATSWGVPSAYGGNGTPGLLWNTSWFSTGAYPYNSAVIKFVATDATHAVGCSNTSYNGATNPVTPAVITAANITAADLAPGMSVWVTHPHPTNGSPVGTNSRGQTMLPVSITETAAESKTLSVGELGNLTNGCSYIANNGNGQGQCSCPTENLAGGFVSRKVR